MADTPPTDTTNPTATYTKLRTGAWGVRVPEAVHRIEPGETKRVAVHKRSGEVKPETVRCFWAGEEPRYGRRVALCDIVAHEDVSPREGQRDSF